MGSESLRYQSRFNEETTFRNLHEDSSVPNLVTHDLDKDAVHSPPNHTDLRMVWADAQA